MIHNLVRNRFFWWLAVACYISSFFMPALWVAPANIEFEKAPTSVFGGVIFLLVGYMFVTVVFWYMTLILAYPWFANPFILASFLVVKEQPGRAAWLAGIGFLIGLTTFTLEEVTIGPGSDDRIVAFGVGTYVWLASFLSMLLHALTLQRAKTKF